MEPTLLAKGVKVDAEVILIKENYDNYQKKTGDKEWVLCHYTEFQLEDGSVYKGQYCGIETAPPYREGDIISITITNYTRQVHTFIVDGVNMDTPLFRLKKGYVSSAGTMSIGAPNVIGNGKLTGPIVFLNGTPGEVSLKYAVQHYSNRAEGTPELIIETATLFKKYLLENTH
jgi:hypothetical protein